MATMYSIFFGVLLTAVCGVEGFSDRVLSASVPAQGIFILLDQNEAKNQGLVAQLNCLIISGNKTNSLRSNKSDCLSEILNNSLRLAQPRPFLQASASRSVQPKDYNVIGLRNTIMTIASNEVGVKELTGNNDGKRVEEYLRYTNLGSGYEWCAAYVCWVYGQAGLPAPRNPWSPALFPKARTYWMQGKMLDTGSIDGRSANMQIRGSILAADVFGIYGTKAKRINHVGLVKELSKDYLITIEGNSNDRVESRRRHLRTVHSLSNWAVY